MLELRVLAELRYSTLSKLIVATMYITAKDGTATFISSVTLDDNIRINAVWNFLSLRKIVQTALQSRLIVLKDFL